MYITYTFTYFRVTEIDVVIYLLMIPPPQLAAAKAAAALLWAVAKAFSRKKKEIIFFQDIGESTNFDLKLTKDGISLKLL